MQEFKSERDDDAPYSMLYAIYVLFMFGWHVSISVWNKAALAYFYGFGIADKIDDPKYAMQSVKGFGLNPKTYAEYCGFWFVITFIPCLLFSGPFIKRYRKTKILGWCTLI